MLHFFSSGWQLSINCSPSSIWLLVIAPLYALWKENIKKCLKIASKSFRWKFVFFFPPVIFSSGLVLQQPWDYVSSSFAFLLDLPRSYLLIYEWSFSLIVHNYLNFFSGYLRLSSLQTSNEFPSGCFVILRLFKTTMALCQYFQRNLLELCL